MSTIQAFEFECPVKIHCGDHALEHLPFELRALDATKPLEIGDAAASVLRLLSRDLERREMPVRSFRNAAE